MNKTFDADAFPRRRKLVSLIPSRDARALRTVRANLMRKEEAV